MISSQKKRIGIVRGGRSSEHEASLETGQEIIRRLDEGKFLPVDIYIDRLGQWHVDGVVVTPYTALQHVDIVFNALHGEYGEDGTVQAIIEEIGKPMIGTKSLESRVSFDKNLTKTILKDSGINMPKSFVIRTHQNDLDKKLVSIWQTLNHPMIVKPNKAGSSMGVRLAKSFKDFSHFAKTLLDENIEVLVEEFIQGREVTVLVVENMRGEKYYTTIPLEVCHKGKYFDEKIKISKDYDLRPMNNFSKIERSLVQKIAKHAHITLGLKHYSRSDFIISKRGVYFLEVNTLPALSDKSLAKVSLEESGISLGEFITHIIENTK